MKLARCTGRLTAWIAIFAILLAALAPSVARALSPPQKAMPWTDICSVAGTQAAPATDPISGSGQHQNVGFKHCPLCLNYTGHLALPTAPVAPLPVVGASAEDFPASVTTASAHFIRTAAQPRAPPVNS
ncbi:MAG: DUF2946 domain-containing protein [Rhodocyclales bacterium]|nr:DUF2946 domain-containing protein [Rhodocyclales bacterium]